MFNRDWFKRQSNLNYGGIQNISYTSRVQVSLIFFAKGLFLNVFFYFLLNTLTHNKTLSLNTVITCVIGVFIYAIYGYFKSQRQFLETTQDVEHKLLLEYRMHPIHNQSMYPQLFDSINNACDEFKFTMPNVYLIDDDEFDTFQNIGGFIDEDQIPYLIVSKALSDNCSDEDLNALVIAELLMMNSHWNELIIKNEIWDQIVGRHRWGNVLLVILIFISSVFSNGFLGFVAFFIIAIWWTRGQVIEGFRKNRFDQVKMIQKTFSITDDTLDNLQHAYEYLDANFGDIDLDNSSQDILGMMWLRPIKSGPAVLPFRTQLRVVGIQVNKENTVDTVKKSLSMFKWW